MSQPNILQIGRRERIKPSDPDSSEMQGWQTDNNFIPGSPRIAHSGPGTYFLNFWMQTVIVKANPN
jgi:hypothetical protein